MANEIYDSTWWGNTIQTASSIGTSTEMIQGQFNLTKLGDEEIVNGGFDTDSGWTLVGETEIVEDGARIYSSSGGQSYIVQSVAPLTISKNYKFSYEITDSTQGSLKLINVNGVSDFPIPSTIGTHIVYFIADNSSFFIYRNSGATDVTIDNVSVKEVRATEVEAVKCLADAIHRIGIQDIQN